VDAAGVGVFANRESTVGGHQVDFQGQAPGREALRDYSEAGVQMSDELVEKVARAILETDPTCNYAACKEKYGNESRKSYDDWWESLHDQARNAIAAAFEWQPIETAPKDGTMVLVWIPAMLPDEYKTVPGFFDPNPADGGWCDVNGSLLRPEAHRPPYFHISLWLRLIASCNC